MRLQRTLQRLPNYLISLPERMIRTTAALGGGVVNETSRLLLPVAVRRTRFYQSTIDRLLRIVVELVGDVRDVYEPDELSPEELLMRKAAGNVVEAASIVAVGWSPIWLLAGVSDLVGGTRVYLRALVSQLEQYKVLPPDSVVDSFEELLDRLEQTSGTIADTIDVPPVNVKDLRTAWATLRTQASDIPNADRLAQIFIGLQVIALYENRSLLEISSIIALGAVKAGLELGNMHVFDYYRTAIESIYREGLVVYLSQAIGPYLSRAKEHWMLEATTTTERMIERFLGQLGLGQRETLANQDDASAPDSSGPEQ